MHDGEALNLNTSRQGNFHMEMVEPFSGSPCPCHACLNGQQGATVQREKSNNSRYSFTHYQHTYAVLEIYCTTTTLGLDSHRP